MSEMGDRCRRDGPIADNSIQDGFIERTATSFLIPSAYREEAKQLVARLKVARFQSSLIAGRRADGGRRARVSITPETKAWVIKLSKIVTRMIVMLRVCNCFGRAKKCKMMSTKSAI